MDDMISRQAVNDVLKELTKKASGRATLFNSAYAYYRGAISDVYYGVKGLPSAQPEQRYTEEELLEFRHGISISLLSKRSSQHWHYDEDTATEIKFLERLYEKVCADMRGEQDVNH